MEKRTLGDTGIDVSVVGIGSWQMGGADKTDDRGIGHGWGGADDRVSIELIHKAQDLGINLIDTADIYGNGHSETVVGNALRGRRDHWVIATKGGLIKTPGKRGQHGDASAAHIRQACEASLNRLQTDVIDLYQLHVMPGPGQIVDTMAELAKLRGEGKIRFYGISTDLPAAVITLQDQGPVDVVQLATDIFKNQHAALAYCHEQSIGTLIRSPLSWGAAFGKFAKTIPRFEPGDLRAKGVPEDMKKNHRRGLRFEFLWENTGRSPAQAALRAVIDKPGVTAVIPGTRTLEHLLDNAGAATTTPISPTERARIWQLNLESDQ